MPRQTDTRYLNSYIPPTAGIFRFSKSGFFFFFFRLFQIFFYFVLTCTDFLDFSLFIVLEYMSHK